MGLIGCSIRFQREKLQKRSGVEQEVTQRGISESCEVAFASLSHNGESLKDLNSEETWACLNDSCKEGSDLEWQPQDELEIVRMKDLGDLQSVW